MKFFKWFTGKFFINPMAKRLLRSKDISKLFDVQYMNYLISGGKLSRRGWESFIVDSKFKKI